MQFPINSQMTVMCNMQLFVLIPVNTTFMPLGTQVLVAMEIRTNTP